MSGMQTLTTLPSVINSVAPIDNCNVITPAGSPAVDPCPNITNTSFMVPTMPSVIIKGGMPCTKGTVISASITTFTLGAPSPGGVKSGTVCSPGAVDTGKNFMKYNGQPAVTQTDFMSANLENIDRNCLQSTPNQSGVIIRGTSS
jgi:hypothetical protein